MGRRGFHTFFLTAICFCQQKFPIGYLRKADGSVFPAHHQGLVRPGSRVALPCMVFNAIRQRALGSELADMKTSRSALADILAYCPMA